MRAMMLERVAPLGEEPEPLKAADSPDPVPGPGDILIRVAACGVCHTELDEIEGRMPPPRLPIIPGHQAVGRVEAVGSGAAGWRVGDRAGAAWIFSACGHCSFCREGRENLCPEFRATGRDADGGYTDRLVMPAAFAIPIPDGIGDHEAAPLLCAGAIGWRSLRLSGYAPGKRLGLTGFGASAHLVLRTVLAADPMAQVFVFARDEAQRRFAIELGAEWAGNILDAPPKPLDAVIDTTPAWTPIVGALRALAPGGTLVINAIRKESADKEALLRLDYPSDLWMEKEIRSVANVTRVDVNEFLSLAARTGLRPEVRDYALRDANRALGDLRRGGFTGALVLRTN
ncbi:MAG TPA: zinc-dependent alcohol dehydrogenase family protein [Candidatus Polarisedimenticolia bacterium]|nr:zinc-dependent alcohol dehydrogenase family protein [Candidatus Polarisedimenticolia bacterium]